MKISRLVGFTLIEVMITVAIVAILAAIAYPSYIDYITKSARSEGVAAVMKLANLQEQYYLDNRVYATDMGDLGLPLKDGAYLTEHGYYKYSVGDIEVDDKIEFAFIAEAQGSQATRDSACKQIAMTPAGVQVPEECWK